MNKSMLAVLVSGVLVTGAVQAAAQDNTWYIGGKAGWSNYYGVDHNELTETIAQTLGNTSDSSDDLGLGLLTGYQLNANLALELGYDWLGQYQTKAAAGGYTFNADAQAQMIQATMKLGFPATNELDLYGRLGGAYAWTESEFSLNDTRATGKKHGAAFVGALGAEYTINRDWAARLEYQYTTPLGDSSLDRAGIELDNGLLSLGIIYRFGQQGGEVIAPAVEPAVVIMEPRTFTLNSDVLFEFNKATLKPAANQALDALFNQIVAANPKDGVATVIGYTDRLGADSYNRTLSEQRALSVANYLVAKGLYADKVQAEGRGKANPVTGDSCTSRSRQELIACLAPDRRVEVHLKGVSLPAQ